VFCGRFWGGGEAGMGGFTAEFRGFWGWARARHGDSAHGGHGRANWAKNFLKKGVKNRENGV